MESLYPQAGWVEIDPDVLWLQFVAVIKESVKGNWIYKSRDGNVYFVYNKNFVGFLNFTYNSLLESQFPSSLGRKDVCGL